MKKDPYKFRRPENRPDLEPIDYLIDGKEITFYGPIKLGVMSAVLDNLQRQHPELMSYNVKMVPIKPPDLHGRRYS